MKTIVSNPQTLGVDSVIRTLHENRNKVEPELVCVVVTDVLNENDHSAEISSIVLVL
jgi:hypothetical protein